jgi:hypothetical protein
MKRSNDSQLVTLAAVALITTTLAASNAAAQFNDADVIIAGEWGRIAATPDLREAYFAEVDGPMQERGSGAVQYYIGTWGRGGSYYSGRQVVSMQAIHPAAVRVYGAMFGYVEQDDSIMPLDHEELAEGQCAAQGGYRQQLVRTSEGAAYLCWNQAAGVWGIPVRFRASTMAE